MLRRYGLRRNWAFRTELYPQLATENVLDAVDQPTKGGFSVVQAALPTQHLHKFTCLSDPYVAGGRKTYLIGRQNGRFPDMGGHVPHEMGGMWSHPIKVIDGFWLGVGPSVDQARWLPEAVGFWKSSISVGHIYGQREGLRIEQETWAAHDAEAIVVTYRIQGAHGPITEPVPLVFLARVDLRGAWLSERLGWKDGKDEARYVADAGYALAWDPEMPFHAVVGAACGRVAGCATGEIWGPERTAGNGTSVALSLLADPNAAGEAEVTVVIASSSSSQKEAVATWNNVASDLGSTYRHKAEVTQDLLSFTRLEAPDAPVVETLNDIKLGYEQLYREVDGYGEGLGAGLPEYPWWFGTDNSYAVQGAVCVGRFEVAQNTLRLLARISEETNGNGRIIHEATTHGVVFNPGNTQETPHFTMAVWDTFLWTGDTAFLRELYPTCKKGVLDWLLDTMDTDGDLFPEGYGIMEVAGVNWELIDTAVYTHEALKALGHMADLVHEPDVVAQCKEQAERLREFIEARFWSEEEQLYADLIASPSMLMERMQHIRNQHGNEQPAMQEALDAIEARCKASENDDEQAWLLKNWVIFCPMEVGLAPQDRAIPALDRMLTAEFTGRFGLYLSGINQTSMMTISTGVGAVSQARYHRMEAALGMIHQICSTRNLRFPGSPSEMSPDWGCFIQAWTGYGLAYPVVRQFFGINPIAHERKLVLAPHPPRSWPVASLKQVRVGGATFDFAYRVDSSANEVTLVIQSDDPGWTIDFHIDPAWFEVTAGDYALLVNRERKASGSAGKPLKARWETTGHDVVVLRYDGEVNG